MKERLTDKEKLKHMAVCLCASIVSPEFAIGLALGKEYGDKCAKGNHWCWFDLLADAIGIALGCIIRFILF